MRQDSISIDTGRGIRQSLAAALLLLLSRLSFSVKAFSPMQTTVHPNEKNVPSGTTRLAASSVADASPPTHPSSARGVIWDIDGTLADSSQLGFDATLVVLERNNIAPITMEIYHDYTRYATPERMARHAGLTEEDHGDEFHRVGKLLGDEFDEFYVNLVDTKTAGFFPGMENVLQQVLSLETIKLGALTNACVGYAHAVLKTNGYHDHFQSIKGADNVPKPKPHPDGLFSVAKDLNLQPSDCIYIGDSPSDAAAAKNAGMQSIGVLWGSHSEEKVREAPFDYVCSQVEELHELLPSKQSTKKQIQQ
jgi:HAD superfamily hydrolase (TIGR01509 family)